MEIYIFQTDIIKAKRSREGKWRHIWERERFVCLFDVSSTLALTEHWHHSPPRSRVNQLRRGERPEGAGGERRQRSCQSQYTDGFEMKNLDLSEQFSVRFWLFRLAITVHWYELQWTVPSACQEHMCARTWWRLCFVSFLLLTRGRTCYHSFPRD